jgi:hypothetical protein
LFPFNSREKELLRERKHGLPEVEYIDLEAEEERDQDMINVTFQNYNKVFRHLYQRYGNSGFTTKIT